ncbi:hypothetical protein JQC92_00280 [Shewanella sp. 202IG2-18]|uniref:LPS-assembly lipoprotein LptE n=1 Tax=Parashewanella hymeniacidonis TaxID=2807618 RepID=UPI00196074E4|nr:LPS assembly lipoprotein LptE [Parashewanella hymeniacidonis]MBM7070489.1 hypothetical protein [Parashewanella hymeniacidonis]
MLIKRIVLALMALSIMFSAGCGFKLQSSYSIPADFRNMNLTSQDQYSELTRLVKERLRFNNITLVDDLKAAPRLNLLKDSLERSTLSLYPTGNVAEYELIYHVRFTIAFPEKEAVPYDAVIRRDYQDDPRTALAKSREMDLLVKEMRQQAADKIIQTIASVE